MSFESVVNVPSTVRALVGEAMTEVALYIWWTTPLDVFNNRRPMDAWNDHPEAGTRDEVINFIKSRQGGDMA